ncbi:MAG: RNA methyltransferase [Alphaproteobacteria bacterium]|nr:RNA methyltransferase [Alphaproteobacteria bacterium]
MAGTDSTQTPATGGPAIVLIDAQLGENVGTAVRAMWNCGLDELRLVNPREGWLNEKTVATTAGADAILEKTKIYATTEEAVSDLQHIFATTARPRDMEKPVFSPREAAQRMRAAEGSGGKIGILFGPERAGLTNDDVTFAEAIVEVPLNPAFASLNLAQAVLLIGYEWFQAGRVQRAASDASRDGTRPATQAELLDLFRHLEGKLDACGFLRVQEKRPGMVRNIRNIFTRAGLTDREVSTLRGIVTGLTQRKD